MISSQDICWLAGLMEGEGTFIMTSGRSPTMTIQMNDKDVITRVAELTRGPVYGPYWYKRNNGVFRTSIHGQHAIGWMMTLYSQLGERRRAKIREVLATWQASKRNPRRRLKI
jgi:hypothetical protein